jgi:outer membrane lipoprotein-sorting protein
MNAMRTVSLLLLTAAALSVDQPSLRAADDLLARTRAAYAALRSYADTGTVDYEFGPASAPLREHHTFKTFYRAPRHYFFDFVKQRNVDRYVVWSDDEVFHTWWQQAQVAQTYPKGQGTAALTNGTTATLHAIMQITPLLFAQAGLTGTLNEIGELSDAGTESVNGHMCRKITGTAKAKYQATGNETNVRRATVWIDMQTLLVRRIFEDTPQGGPAGNVMRYTTTFDPQPNPQLDDSQFTFTPPGGRK